MDSSAAQPAGRTVTAPEGACYEIRDYDAMKPFLMTIAGSRDHWMYLSSTGGLTCGRRSPDQALFPYYTDDKIHDAIHTTGPVTVVRVRDNEAQSGSRLWLPFSDRFAGLYELRRNLLKRLAGDMVIFEEHNKTLGLVFRYSWRFSPRWGFVREASLHNGRREERQIELLDGVRNVLPAGVDRTTQERGSTLVDAYKLSELDPETGLGIYSMSSLITDRAEPSEALVATTVWQAGLSPQAVLLSEEQLEGFVRGAVPHHEEAIRGRRGAYLVAAEIALAGGATTEWMVVADTGGDSVAVADLAGTLAETPDHTVRRDRVRRDATDGEYALLRLVAQADGLQYTDATMIGARHYSNVLFNIMRGGIPVAGYRIERDDLISFLADRNRMVFAAHRNTVEGLPSDLEYRRLLSLSRDSGDRQFERLVLEYLPFTFSRRHGDPSRPWNRFSIEVESADGQPRLAWQGNWRDIFQNWEALALSFPRYLAGMIATFLNATTPDGYNPYRISRDGIDWEVFDPEDPWSNIGYWGDHQIVYLWRLLELLHRHEPAALAQWLERRLFASAAVPYRIRSFDAIVANPHESIDFDDAAAAEADRRVADLGADGKLEHDGDEPRLVSLAEKLLITVLTKLSNYVPDGGIWMNTQRPEWNDANNALAGWGLSVVTLAYLRGMVTFLLDLFPDDGSHRTELSADVAGFLEAVATGLPRRRAVDGALSPDNRYTAMEALGRAGTAYRASVYTARRTQERVSVPYTRLRAVLETARDELDATIRANRRNDGLYHSYNVLHLEGQRATVERLSVMLEGQVAMLASGVLDTAAAAELLQSLYDGPLFRHDARSFTLYPDRRLPAFLEKNRVPDELLAAAPWLDREAGRGGGAIIRRDRSGVARFNGAFRNARDLAEELDRLAVPADDRAEALRIYEAVFSHRAFTGRSGTFFKYEGLGSIYWHMVSKLNLAVLETVQRGGMEIADWYHRIKEGIGAEKTPQEYGAFPFDPYSHTPSFVGAQQPGMTGQVKEDIIARFGELGVEVVDGRVRFVPRLLSSDEFSRDDGVFRYLDVSGTWQELPLPAGSIAFTYCQVPVVYRIGDAPSIQVFRRGESADDGAAAGSAGAAAAPAREPLALTYADSQALFDRSGEILRIVVRLGDYGSTRPTLPRSTSGGLSDTP